MERSIVTIPSQPQNQLNTSIDFSKLLVKFFNLESGLFISFFLLLVIISQLGSKKGKISTGRLTGITEKLAATNLALK